MPLVSVVLPFYNAAGTLLRAASSILEQHHRELELILVDDASTDNSPDIARSLAADSRVVLLSTGNTNLGVVSVFQIGLLHAKGEYIARMDADDWAHPAKITRQLAYLETDGAIDGVSCRVKIVGNVESPEGQPREGFQRYEQWLNELCEPEAIFAERFVESPIVNPTLLARRSLWEQLGGYADTDGPEDYDFFLRAMEAGLRFRKLPEVLFHWQDGPGRLTRSSSRYSELAFQQTKAKYLARLPAVLRHGVCISGAGPIGKTMASLLTEREVRLVCFYEVNQRQVGESWRGIPIRGSGEIPKAQEGTPVQLGAVGQAGRRAIVTKLFTDLGYQPGVNFFAIA